MYPSSLFTSLLLCHPLPSPFVYLLPTKRPSLATLAFFFASMPSHLASRSSCCVVTLSVSEPCCRVASRLALSFPDWGSRLGFDLGEFFSGRVASLLALASHARPQHPRPQPPLRPLRTADSAAGPLHSQDSSEHSLILRQAWELSALSHAASPLIPPPPFHFLLLLPPLRQPCSRTRPSGRPSSTRHPENARAPTGKPGTKTTAHPTRATRSHTYVPSRPPGPTNPPCIAWLPSRYEPEQLTRAPSFEQAIFCFCGNECPDPTSDDSDGEGEAQIYCSTGASPCPLPTSLFALRPEKDASRS